MNGSRITNGVLASSPSFFSLCGSHVSSPPGNRAQGVVVTGARSSVRVGDPAMGCAGNRVAGDVSLTGTIAGLTLGPTRFRATSESTTTRAWPSSRRT